MSWQPIETAPKDKQILLYRPSAVEWWQVAPGEYDNDMYGKRQPFWYCDMAFVTKTQAKRCPPTHWQPLPEPPTQP